MIENNELVSIVIPVYNRENLIVETIDSALNQTYSSIEIIIVDNCSTDKTWEVITKVAEKDLRIKIFQNDINIGPVRNWKKCIEYSSGEYIKILWSDDLIHPSFIEKTLPLFKNSNVGFVYTQAVIFSNSNSIDIHNNVLFKTDISSGVHNSKVYIDGIYNNLTFSGYYPYSPGCAIFKAGSLKKNLLVDIPNKFKIDFAKEAIGNDVLIFLLTSLDFSKFGYLDEPYSYFRKHEGSISTISSNKLDLIYTISKCIFIESNKEVFDVAVIKKFNSIIKIILKDNVNNKYGIKKPSDIYKYSTVGYNYLYLVKKMFSSWIKKIGLNSK